MLNILIENLKKQEYIWKEFNCSYTDYDKFFKEADKFLKSKDINIVHGYDYESLRIEYIIYYKGKIIDLGNDLNVFANPYWTIIENCFKYLNEQYTTNNNS